MSNTLDKLFTRSRTRVADKEKTSDNSLELKTNNIVNFSVNITNNRWFINIGNYLRSDVEGVLRIVFCGGGGEMYC